ARALRAEGTSHHYLPAAESVGTDPQVRAACIAAIEARGHPAVEVTTWTTDGFYRETPAMIDRRLGQGCSVVEMECAAWAAWAQYRGVRFGQILFTADSLAGGVYDPRDWGTGSHEVALRMAIDAAFTVQD
ncbi:MAG: phosphorylase, partial [Brooklawnia sp.]